ncbi:hypothetical protein D9601_01920 [Sphingomonas sp. MA1305]|nr:hypothetical protein [Sphingomonas sp. MA1305]
MAMAIRDVESRVALAMLPVGTLLSLLSAIGGVAVVALAIDVIIRRPAGTGWWLAWCLVAAMIAAWNTRRSLETLASFEWRTALPVLVLSMAIVAAYPGWWS